MKILSQLHYMTENLELFILHISLSAVWWFWNGRILNAVFRTVFCTFVFSSMNQNLRWKNYWNTGIEDLDKNKIKNLPFILRISLNSQAEQV